MAVPSDERQKMATVKSKLEDVISISFLVTLTKCLTETREGRGIWAQSSRKFCTTEEETSGAEVPATRSRDGEGHFRPSTAFKGIPLVTYTPQLASAPQPFKTRTDGRRFILSFNSRNAFSSQRHGSRHFKSTQW